MMIISNYKRWLFIANRSMTVYNVISVILLWRVITVGLLPVVTGEIK